MERLKGIETLKRQKAFYVKIIVRVEFAPFPHGDGLVMLRGFVADFLRSVHLSVISVL